MTNAMADAPAVRAAQAAGAVVATDRRCSTHFIVGTKSEVMTFMACLFAGRLEQPDAQASGGGEGGMVTEAAEDFAMMTGMEPSEFAEQV